MKVHDKLLEVIRAHLASLEGGCILSVVFQPREKNDICPHVGLLVERVDGSRVMCWVDRDSEGHGPGWLDVQRVPVS